MLSCMKATQTRLLVPFILLVWFAGCSPKAGDVVVASVGEDKITMAEFETMYLKSNGSREQAAASTMEERTKFLDLLTKFRLKLADAYSKGMAARPEIQREVQQYKGSLAASYLTDRKVTAPGTELTAKRRTEEVRASHILINLSSDASSEDSAAAYTKAYEVIAKLKAGADFTATAQEFSQDPSVKQNNGDLYYFTSGQMVPSFEDAVFAMKVGETSSAPVRTQFGLHIIRVTDRKPAPGEVQCSHIMARFEKQDPSPDDTLKAYQKIKTIQDSINMGTDFAALAMRNSEDPGSASRGGDLGWFTRRRWIQSFDEVALTLSAGQVSNIIRTVYGYHIIKCVDRKPAKGGEEAKKEAQQIYQQVRYNDDYKKYLDGLKRETGFSMNEAAFTAIVGAIDTNSTTKDTAWAKDITPEIRNMPLFRFGARSVSVDSTLELMAVRPDLASAALRPVSLRSSLDKISEQLVFDVRGETIEKDYPEFAAIMKEYTEGILLYQVEQEQVWNRITVSDSALRAYHDLNKDRFTFPDRVDISSLRVANDSIATAIRNRLIAGTTMEKIAWEDSLRMHAPTSYQGPFKKNSSALSKKTLAGLATIAKEVTGDPSLRISLIAYYDTTKKPATSEKVAKARVAALRTHLIKKYGIAESRVNVTQRIPAKSLSDSARNAMFSRADMEIAGRRPVVFGGLEESILPVDADERTQLANTLTPGSYTEPLQYEGMTYIVRLNKKEPSRIKTFDEAGTEVSSAYQESESRRLEQEWLDGLKTRFPVTENTETLKGAFAPLQ